MPDTEKKKQSAQEALAKLQIGQVKYAAIAQGLQQVSQIATAFDNNPYETGTEDSIGILAGAGAGAMSMAVTGNPVLITAGAGIGLIGGLLSESSKKKQARKRWEQALGQYKAQLKGKQSQIEGQAKQLEKRAKGGALQSIHDATDAAIQNIEKMTDSGISGIKNVTQERRIEAMEDNSIDLVEQTYDKLLAKVDILENASNILEAERTANRSVGQIRTGRLDQFEAEMEKLQNV